MSREIKKLQIRRRSGQDCISSRKISQMRSRRRSTTGWAGTLLLSGVEKIRTKSPQSRRAARRDTRNGMKRNRTVNHDAIVIGAGFGGLDALRVLRDKLGFTVQVFERAPDVGGTWYWNKYPGCQCDIESFVYCYSFDKELLQENTIGNRYLKQPEVLADGRAIAKKYDLYKDIRFNGCSKSVF